MSSLEQEPDMQPDETGIPPVADPDVVDLDVEEVAVADVAAAPAAAAVPSNDESVIHPESSPTQYTSVFDPSEFVQLGDIILIRYKYHKDNTNDSNVPDSTTLIGNVYYRSNDEISIQPLQAVNKLYTFEMEETEEGEEVYKEYHEVSEVIILKKRVVESFVEQQGFYIGQGIDTMKADGTLGTSYIIREINKNDDFIIVAENIAEEKTVEDEPEEVKVLQTIQFDFIGIPRNDEFEFIMIMNKVLQAPEEVNDMVPDETEEEIPVVDDIIEEEDEINVVLPKIYREVKAYEQYIPNDLQKLDAYNELIKLLPLAKQTDPKEIRRINRTIETLFYLKESIVSYEANGTKRIMKPISVKTIADLIATTTIPLGRPVLDVKKKIYDKNEDAETLIFAQFIDERKQMKAELDPPPKPKPSDKPNPKEKKEKAEEPKLTMNLNQLAGFLQRYESPWIPSPNEQANEMQSMYHAFHDTDFFRNHAPELDNANEFKEETEGLNASNSKKEDPTIGKLPFSIERALSITYRKIKYDVKKRRMAVDPNENKELFLPAEHGLIVSYLLFPLDAAAYLGNIRSNHLALDSGLSKLPYMTMRDIILKYGTPVQIGSSDKITIFTPDSTKIGNVPIEDYIYNSTIIGMRMSDMFLALVHYGFTSLELTIPLYDTLVYKIHKYQRRFINEMNRLRDEMKNMYDSASEPLTNYLLDNISWLQLLYNQPIIKEDLLNYEKYNPTLIASDVGKLCYLFRKYSEYVQVSIGRKSDLIAIARESVIRMQYIEAERNRKLADENTSTGRIMANRCKHVSSLVTIRKIYDDTERFTKLIEWYKQFQGTFTDNWTQCKVCHKNLLCIHERLQLQGFIFPAEKSEIDKKILLVHSGGQFQGRFICKHCGQAIREFEFDNTIEFDDEGRPKSGHTALEDDIEVVMEKILNEVIETKEHIDSKRIKFITPDSRHYYTVLGRCIGLMGIDFSVSQINQTLVRIEMFMGKYISTKEEYDSTNEISYEEYHATAILYITIVFIFLEIQSTIPPYHRQYIINSAVYHLNGYPLTDDKHTVVYMSIVLMDSVMNVYPWNAISFFTKADKQMKLEDIATELVNYIDLAIQNQDIAEGLRKRRKYDSTATTILEEVPASFLPEPIYMVKQKRLDTSGMALQSNKRNMIRVNYWIKMAHDMVEKEIRESQKGVRHSVFAESSCCPVPINNPQWKRVEDDTYSIGIRGLFPKQIPMLSTPFVPRPLHTDLIKPDAELYYRLFLTYCAKGPFKGHVHELGITNKCIRCGFTFPESDAPNKRIAQYSGTSKVELKRIADGIEAKNREIVQNNDITASKAEFTHLLDIIHTKHAAFSYDMPQYVTPLKETLQELSAARIPNWDNVCKDIANILPHLHDSDITGKLNNIATVSSQFVDTIKRLYTKDLRKKQVSTLEDDIRIIAYIGTLPWNTFCDTLQSYFVVPFQRLISNFSDSMLKVPFELEAVLSESHVSSGINKIIETEIELFTTMTISNAIADAKKYPKNPENRTEEQHKDIATLHFIISDIIQKYTTSLSSIISFKHAICFREMKTGNIKIDEMFLQYIKNIILCGSLHVLLNENTEPIIQNILMEALSIQLKKCYHERVIFDPKVIAERIEVRNEKERSNILNKFNNMDEDERKLEILKKKLGLGDWSVGGTKLIYAYNADYWDLEREKRIEAGIDDFPGLHDNQPVTTTFDIFTMDAGREDDGYDVREQNDD
jgi:hypothetical protein